MGSSAQYRECYPEVLRNIGNATRQQEGNATRQQQDNLVKMQWLAFYVDLQYLLPLVRSASLQNIATKYLATEEIQKSLLDARLLGQRQVDAFIKEWLVVTEAGSNSLVSLYAPLQETMDPHSQHYIMYPRTLKKRTRKEQ